MFKILKKELKDSFRDRRTFLLTVFLPMILMSGIVFFYENLISEDEENIYDVVVNEDQLDFAQQLLSSYENIHLIGGTDVLEEVESGNALAGIIIPSDFESSITQGSTPTIQIIGDMYSQNSALAASILENAFTFYSQQLVASRLEASGLDRDLLLPFVIDNVQVVEGDDSMYMIAFLIPLMLSVAVGIGIAPTASDYFAGEKERRTMEALLMTPVNRGSLLLGKWCSMVMIASITGIITLLIVTVEIVFFTENLKAGLAVGDQAIAIIVITILVVIAYAALMSSALMITSMIAKTVKESQSYGTPVSMIVFLPALLTTNLGLNELTTFHFAVPLMNLFTIFKELFFGVVNMEHAILTITSNLIVALLIFMIGRILFLKDRWVLTNS